MSRVWTKLLLWSTALSDAPAVFSKSSLLFHSGQSSSDLIQTSNCVQINAGISKYAFQVCNCQKKLVKILEKSNFFFFFLTWCSILVGSFEVLESTKSPLGRSGRLDPSRRLPTNPSASRRSPFQHRPCSSTPTQPLIGSNGNKRSEAATIAK